jgi:hypothetical protein
MSISVGGINIAESIINLDYELNRTQQILEWVIKNNEGVSGPPSYVMKDIDETALNTLIKKYPDAGIQKK